MRFHGTPGRNAAHAEAGMREGSQTPLEDGPGGAPTMTAVVEIANGPNAKRRPIGTARESIQRRDPGDPLRWATLLAEILVDLARQDLSAWRSNAEGADGVKSDGDGSRRVAG